MRSLVSRSGVFLQGVAAHPRRGDADAFAQHMGHVLLAREAAGGSHVGQAERTVAQHVGGPFDASRQHELMRRATGVAQICLGKRLRRQPDHGGQVGDQ